MHLHILRRRDFIAGSLFIAFGVAAAGGALRYPLGTAMRMGPGYFPLLLGGLLALLGLTIALAALRVVPDGEGADDGRVERISFKPVLLVAVGVLLFALTVNALGLVLATVALVVVSGIAHHETRWREVAVLAAGLAAFAVGVFFYGLGLPFEVLPVAVLPTFSALFV